MNGQAAIGPEPQPIWTKDYVLAWFCRFFFFFSLNLLQPTLPLYLEAQGIGPAALGGIIAIFTLVASLFRPLVGYQADIRGPRTVLLIALALFMIGPVGYALTAALPMLMLFRFIHGAGWSGCTAAANTVVASRIPADRRGEALGMYSVAASIASAVAAAPGVWIYYKFGATPLFYLSSAFAVLAWITVILLSPDQPMKNRGVAVPTVTQYFRSFFTRQTLAVTLPMSAVTFANGGLLAFLPLHAVASGLTNPGLYFMVMAISLALSRPLTGRLSDRVSRSTLVLPSFILNIIPLALLAWMPGTWSFYLSAVIYGLGYGAVHSGLQAELVDVAPADRQGAAMAQWSLFYDVGIGGGSAVFGLVLRITGNQFPWMYIVAILVLVAAAGVYLYTHRRDFRWLPTGS